VNIVQSLPQDKELGFGIYFAPEMIVAHYKNSQWQKSEIIPTQNFQLHPAAKVLHYAQEIFEGLKAFNRKGEICLFRPHDNIRRMSISAEIMAMPPYPEEDFLESMKVLVRKSSHLVPSKPGALYLRPTMIGTSTALGVAPATEYLFFVLASPVGGYFGKVAGDKPSGISIWVTSEYTRAAPGGLGVAKTGANYAASLRAVAQGKKAGYSNVLFLDSERRKYIEELSGMNVFVVHNGVLKTSPLKDTILDGVTRRTLIELAKNLKIPFEETQVSIDDLIAGTTTGAFSEMLACGTGASVTAISELGWKDQKISINQGKIGPVTQVLYENLLAIQNGDKEPLHKDWIIKC